jgi:hypothetical protein
VAGQLRFTASDHVARIPLDVRLHHLWFRGTVNGRDSLWFVLDTGAGGDCIRDSVADRLGLKGGRSRQAMGSGGSVPTRGLRGVDLRAPGVELLGGAVTTLPLQEVGATAGRHLDVIVGHPWLARTVATIDYTNQRLELRPAEGWEYRGDGAVIPVTFEDGHPYVTARVTLPGGAPIEGRFVLDTGNVGALILGPEFVTEHRVLESVGPTVQGLARGVGGQSMNPVGRVERLELGGFALERPVTTFRTPGPGQISAPGSAGNIGGAILSRFTVILDYSRKRMILEPNARLRDPFEYDMSGLRLRAEGRDLERIVVARVQEQTPGEAAGLREGDAIESVDGRPSGEIGLPLLREWLRTDGKELRLGVRRGDARLDVTLRTRRLI